MYDTTKNDNFIGCSSLLPSSNFTATTAYHQGECEKRIQCGQVWRKYFVIENTARPCMGRVGRNDSQTRRVTSPRESRWFGGPERTNRGGSECNYVRSVLCLCNKEEGGRLRSANRGPGPDLVPVAGTIPANGPLASRAHSAPSGAPSYLCPGSSLVPHRNLLPRREFAHPPFSGSAQGHSDPEDLKA